MWNMFSTSVQLLFKGKLFREPRAVFRQWSIGFALTVIIVVLLVKVGAPVGLAVLVTALIAGALQPLLFKNLKYQ
jgi:hypothetical protein